MLLQSLLVAAALAGSGAQRSESSTRGHEARPDARDEAAWLLGMVLAGEPRIAAVQRAAEARAAPSREEADGWQRRSRLSALLPKLGAQLRHDERSYRVVGLTSGAEVDYLRSMPGDTLTVRLDFDLPALVFGRQELQAVAAAQNAEARRRAAVERATKLYYERLRLRLTLLSSPPEEPDARAAMEIDLEAVTAELHALTGLYGGLT